MRHGYVDAYLQRLCPLQVVGKQGSQLCGIAFYGLCSAGAQVLQHLLPYLMLARCSVHGYSGLRPNSASMRPVLPFSMR